MTRKIVESKNQLSNFANWFVLESDASRTIRNETVSEFSFLFLKVFPQKTIRQILFSEKYSALETATD